MLHFLLISTDYLLPLNKIKYVRILNVNLFCLFINKGLKIVDLINRFKDKEWENFGIRYYYSFLFKSQNLFLSVFPLGFSSFRFIEKKV